MIRFWHWIYWKSIPYLDKPTRDLPIHSLYLPSQGHRKMGYLNCTFDRLFSHCGWWTARIRTPRIYAWPIGRTQMNIDDRLMPRESTWHGPGVISGDIFSTQSITSILVLRPYLSIGCRGWWIEPPNPRCFVLKDILVPIRPGFEFSDSEQLL